MKYIALALLTLFLALANAQAESPARIPVIFDTDIGDDIDDTWALTLLLKSPQLDLKLVTTTYGKAEYRAKIIARLLTVAKRTDVPVGLGTGGRDGIGRQQDWVKNYQLKDYAGKIHQDGVAALIELIEASPQPITVISVGPCSTVAAALQRRPQIAGKAFFVGMDGSVPKATATKDPTRNGTSRPTSLPPGWFYPLRGSTSPSRLSTPAAWSNSAGPVSRRW